MRILINRDGTLKMIYTDSVDVRDMGDSEITRVGRVEPTEECMWRVDVRGEEVGRYSLREEALRAEVARVEEEL